MYEYELLGAVNNLYDVNDRLGVELMGKGAWNGLKRAVTTMSANAIRNANVGRRAANIKGNARRVNIRLNGDADDALCRALWGFNDEYAAELLGSYGWSDFTRQVRNLTHKALEAGENIPVVDAAVDRFRQIENVFSTGSKAADTVQTVYDNRGKIILIGGLGALGLYLLLRKKR